MEELRKTGKAVPYAIALMAMLDAIQGHFALAGIDLVIGFMALCLYGLGLFFGRLRRRVTQ